MFEEFKKFAMRGLLTGLFAAAMSSGALAAPNGSPPADAASAFYAVYSGFHPSGGIPDAAGRAKYAPTITPALEKLLADAESIETRFHQANKNAPPLLEGDIFTSMFEGATAVRLSDCMDGGEKASCAATLSYDDKSGKTVRWTDMVYLVMTTSGWRVDDIGYGGNWQYANRGKLSETLRQIITDAGN